jgi:putative NADH-flavin reductase
MRIAITGGTGFVGRHLARALADAGHEVVLIARGRDCRDLEVRYARCVSLISASIDDLQALKRAFAGCAAIAHCAGINREIGDQTYQRVHVQGTKAVVQAARHADVQKVVELRGARTGQLPRTSKFGSLDEASAFFEKGALGYSETTKGDRLDGLYLVTKNWCVEPLEVQHVHSSFFSDLSLFPSGSVDFDCALLMRNIEHQWERAPDLPPTGYRPRKALRTRSLCRSSDDGPESTIRPVCST